jgi:hypothetical protein
VLVKHRRDRPGPRKASPAPLLHKRHVELWASSDYRIRQMFEAADVMSEGALRPEANGAVYYGTTSIVLWVVSKGGQIPDETLVECSRLLRLDPHARLRAVRVAWREAAVRAAVPLGQLRAELAFSTTPFGVKIDVDVEAEQQEQFKRSRSTG